MLSKAEVQAIAHDLLGQHARKETFANFPERVPTLDDANDVQDAYVALLCQTQGTEVGGYKIALTSKSTRDWLKIDHPCAGQVLSNRIHQSPYTVHLSDYVRFSMETEICVVLDRDMAGECTIDDVRRNLRSIHCAYELVEDRGADLTRLDARSLVSDNSWNGGIVIGPPGPVDLVLENRAGRLKVNGKVTKEGTTRETMGGNPLHVMVWLIGHLGKRGKSLKAGQPVITGSIIETQFPVAGDVLVFEVDDMPPVELRVIT
jgi:2-oxo-3-hexenedioate decarboxylase/2-keto-4-pentenoate hydratase